MISFKSLSNRIRRALHLKTEDGVTLGSHWIPDSARLRHTQIVGATGTGKTVLLENLIFSDLKRGYGAFIIDPKGERDFYDHIKAYCKEIGRESDLFLLSATHPEESCSWNPCSLGNTSELQTKFFQSTIYSEPYYAKACEFGLLKAFKEFEEAGKKTISLKDLVSCLEVIAQKEKQETLKGLFFDLNNLVYGEWEPILNDTTKKKKSVSLQEITKNNQILFIDLPTEGKKVQSSRIGRLLTQEIILLSGKRKRDSSLKGSRPFSVYIDEFDAFASESFSTFLNKGRSSDFMIHLAHQTLSDLNCISPEFTGQIMGNCNLRFIFRQDDPDDAERWSRFIGTHQIVKKTFQTQSGSSTGAASNRVAQEFIVAPDEIKTLPVGRCVFSIKTENKHKVIKVPFRKRVLQQKQEVLPSEIPPSTEENVTKEIPIPKKDLWKAFET